MNAKSLSALLTELRACEAAREFADGKTLREAWDSCERADWLLWLTGEMAGKKGWPTRKEVVLAACACAETALTFLPKEEERPRKCIEVSRAWANGDASLEQVRVAKRNAYAAAYAAAAYAADSADSAAAAAYAYAAAAYAADSAASASAAAAYAADSADSAAAAAAYAADSAASAYAAAAYAADSADSAARKTALREMADIVRKVLVISAVEGLGK